MKYLLLILLPAVLLLAGCRELDLEREQVILAWGIRYDTPAAAGVFSPNLAHMRDVKMRELVLELPLRADSAGLPMVPPLPLGDMVTLLNRFKTRLHLVFAPTNLEELFPGGRLKAEPAAWFAGLRHAIDSTVAVFGDFSISRVVIGSNLRPVESFTAEWTQLIDSLKAGHDYFVSYGASPDALGKLGFVGHCDELCIDYPPAADDNPKPFCRKVNTQIAALSDSLHKSVFVFRANVIGEQQLEQLKNRLRFWPPATRLRGVAMNSLYARIPLLDSTSYYGLADNPEVIAFLEDYRSRGR
jgi:hypothetical protein